MAETGRPDTFIKIWQRRRVEDQNLVTAAPVKSTPAYGSVWVEPEPLARDVQGAQPECRGLPFQRFPCGEGRSILVGTP